jgi:sigma-B regulation protein RsbU (phosphoserine phosphatase)
MATQTRRAGRTTDFWSTYTRDVTREDLQRLLTHDARDAWRFYSQGIDQKAMSQLPWHVRLPAYARRLFLAFTLKLSPARRILYGVSLALALLGLFELFRGFNLGRIPAGVVRLPVILPSWVDGTVPLLLGFVLLNLLVLLEVADRLSLKDDLEIAREIQLAMLPHDTHRTLGLEVHGQTRPANTVGGDFYDIQPLTDGRVVVALGDVAGKGSPAALLMALLLAMMRTLLDEGLEPAPLVERLNLQIWRHAPRSRFITLFVAVFDPATGEMTYVNAGQNPPLLRRAGGSVEWLGDGGLALGLREGTAYRAVKERLAPGDLVVLYSDGITEAEDPDGVPYDEAGLVRAVGVMPDATAPDLGARIMRDVARHARDHRFADDLTLVVLRRLPPPPFGARGDARLVDSPD